MRRDMRGWVIYLGALAELDGRARRNCVAAAARTDRHDGSVLRVCVCV